MKFLNFLHDIGLSDGQIRVYSAVLFYGYPNINQIHQKTGIERRNIYDILNKLIEKGYVTFTIESGKKFYRCTHPNKILYEIQKKERHLQTLQKHLPDIVNMFNKSKPEIRAEVFRGNEGIKSLLTEILEYDKSFWIGGNSFQNYTAVSKSLQLWFEKWMNRRAKQKHIMYDLVDSGTFLKGLEPSKKRKHQMLYYKFWELPEDLKSPMVIVIFGNKVAQILWSEQSFAFVIESEEIRESFMKYFYYFWEKKAIKSPERDLNLRNAS